MDDVLVLPDTINEINSDTNSGGLSRWVVYSIIATVTLAVIAATIWYIRKRINKTREDGTIIKDVGAVISLDVEKKVVDDLLEVAIRAQTESAQLNADMETAKQLQSLGQISQDKVDKAIVAAEASKAIAIQKNAEAAKALESFRKRELAEADASILEATKTATELSKEYEKISDSITDQKVTDANALLLDLVKKRQQAEKDYNDALNTKNKAETTFLESKKAKAENRRGIIDIMNKKIADLKDKIQRAKITKSPAPQPPAPQPPATQPPATQPPAPKPPTPQPPAPKPPTPKPPAPKPPAPKPPTPSPSAGSVVLLDKEVRVNLSNKTIAKGGGRGISEKWPVPSQFKNAVKMSFDINFQPGFSFVNNTTSEGGKVGGLHVGKGAASGCRHTSDGSSLRLVWQRGNNKNRKGSGASAYTYLPTGTRGKQPAFVEKQGSPDCGLHLFRDDLDQIFSNTGSWYNVTLGIQLNDVGRSNGKIFFEIKGPKSFRAEESGMMWRTSASMDIQEASISSFFGGGGREQYVLPSTFLIKNVMLSPY